MAHKLFSRSWVLALLIGFAVPLASRTFTYARFYVFATPGFYLFAAWGLDWMISRLKRPRGLAPLLVLPALILLGSGLVNYYRLGKQGFRPAAEWIQKNAPGYRVLTLGLTSQVLDFYIPDATVVSAQEGISPAQLQHTVVAVSHLWSVGQANLEVLGRTCGRPLVFPSAGYSENEVLLYRCE